MKNAHRLMIAAITALFVMAGVLVFANPAEARTTIASQITPETNKDRAKYKKQKLYKSDCLTKAAVAQAKRQASKKKMYHQSLSPLFKACKYKMRSLGENVAVGYTSASSVERAWMKSPGHRANILNGGFNRIGVGAARDSKGRIYYAVVFGKYVR